MQPHKFSEFVVDLSVAAQFASLLISTLQKKTKTFTNCLINAVNGGLIVLLFQ